MPINYRQRSLIKSSMSIRAEAKEIKDKSFHSRFFSLFPLSLSLSLLSAPEAIVGGGRGKRRAEYERISFMHRDKSGSAPVSRNVYVSTHG